MSFPTDDPRAQLSGGPSQGAEPTTSTVRKAQFFELASTPHSSVSPLGSVTWLIRAANCVLAWTDAVRGDRLERAAQRDEYAVLLCSDRARVRIHAGGETRDVARAAFVAVPPGDSAIEVLADGPVVRVFSAANSDLTDAALNAEVYDDPDPTCARLDPWPDPEDGFRLREYPLGECATDPERFGRIFRTTNLMANFLPEQFAPRDPRKLSPHAHADFEQLSLAVRGEFVHHIRYPWGSDALEWRPDEHRTIGSPSLAIISPPSVHTTQGVGARQQLVDIFSPPRHDFSARENWVRNSSDYPCP